MRTIKEKVLKEIHEEYDLTKPEKFRCSKAIDLTLKEVEKVIDESKIRACQVFGKFGEGDFVVEEGCPEEKICEVCEKGKLYLMDAEKLKLRLRGN